MSEALRNYLSTDEGAGMTAKPVKKSRRDMISDSMKDM